MRKRKGLLQLGLVFAFPFLVGALCLNSSLVVNQSIWNHKNITNYTMTVRTGYGAVGPIDVQVMVRNNKIVDEKLLECELGKPEYHAGNCEGLTTYYYSPGGQFTYTVENLFQRANSCVEDTKQSLANYGVTYQLGFTGFTSSDVMFDFISTHRSSLTSSDYFCSVEYDPTYGYPNEIIGGIPMAQDATSSIEVAYFHVDE